MSEGSTNQKTNGPKWEVMSVRPADTAGMWHHAVVNSGGRVLSSGDHPSIEEAKAAAEDAVTPAKYKKS